MYRVDPDCWVWSPGPPVCLLPQHSGSLALNVPTHQRGDEEEGETGELPAVCHHITGCQDIISQAAEAQWSAYEPPAHSVVCSTVTLTECDLNAYSSERQIMVIETDQGEISQPFAGGCSWESQRTEAHRCGGVHGPMEIEDMGPCWTGSPLIYYGVTSNIVVGVDVVEEVAVEDTLEVITEDVYADGLMVLEDLQNQQLYPP